MSIAGARLLPLLVWVAATNRLQTRWRVLIFAMASSMVGSYCLWDRGFVASVTPMVMASMYFSALASGVYLLPPLLRRDWFRRDSAAILIATLGVLVPGWFLAGPARVAVVVVGFEFCMSAYSYVAEVSRGPAEREPTFRECAFFLVVDPTVVFTSRGRWTAPAPLSAMGRALLGLFTLALYTALTLLAPSAQGLTGIAWWLAAGTIQIAVICAHSGTASVQIGALGLIGYRVPERYDYPLLATSPLSWWRRWNLYTGAWFQRYVFVPLSLRIGRRLPRGLQRYAAPFALVATFVSSGMAHEVAQFAMGARKLGLVTLYFAVSGVLLLAWEGLRRALEQYTATGSRSGLARSLGASAQWALFIVLNLLLLSRMAGALEGDAS